MTQEAKEFEKIILGLTEAQFEELVSKIPEDMERDLRIHRAAHKLFTNVGFHNAMKKAIRDQFCEEFYGHAHEEQACNGFDPCNPVYMTSIL